MTTNLSVMRWLEELKGSVDMECLSVLQGKSLKKLHFMSPSPARSTFNYQIACFQKLIGLKNEIKAQTQPYKMTNVVDIIDKLGEIKAMCSQLTKHESDDELCSRLDLLVSDFESLSTDFGLKVKSLNGQTPKVKNKKIKHLFNVVNSLLANLMTCLTKDFVENFLRPCLNLYSEDSHNSNINVIMSDDEDDSDVYGIDNEEGTEGSIENDFKTILGHLVTIASSSEDALNLLIQMGVVDQLLQACSSQNKHPTQVLRSLATLCSSKMAVNDFIQNSGFECMAELIDDCSSNQLVRFEVVGVLAMVTSPQMAVHQDMQSLDPYLEILVGNIIDWLSIPGSSASEKLLMVSCLSNITYLNADACEIINNKNFFSVLFPTSSSSLVFFQPHDHPTSELLKYQVLQLISFMAEHDAVLEEHLNDTICEGLAFLLASCLGDSEAFVDEDYEGGSTSKQVVFNAKAPSIFQL